MSTSDKNDIGGALGRIVSGAFIVTAAKGDERTGFLASWVQQASFEPPMVTLAVKRDRSIRGLLDAGASFVINVLAEDEQSLFGHFAKGFAPGEDAFVGISATDGVLGVPILSDALACLECKIVGSWGAGDHMVYVGEVAAGAVGDNEAAPQTRVRKSGFTY
jgi:flavin reductase (DIM6/NTAB) family NADH-FMN oxidoreductase RutF